MTLSSTFFDSVRDSLFHGKLSQPQVDGLNIITQDAGDMDLKQLAYVLATVYHETAGTIQPIAEYGKGINRTYGHKVKQSGKPYVDPKQIYYGRGYCQLTWFENYDRFGKLLGVDLLNNPDLCLNPDISSKIIIIGMNKGLFTGKKLSDYINDTQCDYVNARRIINRLDRAHDIAAYANTFLKSFS